jgi:uncharacterized membrane protein
LWHVKGTTPGQFALYVRAPDAPDLSDDDLVNPAERPLRPTFWPSTFGAPPAANDADLAKWVTVPRTPIPSDATTLQSYLQLINTEHTLFFAITQHQVCAPLNDQDCEVGRLQTAYLDDQADRSPEGAGDHALSTHGSDNELRFRRWDAASGTWLTDPEIPALWMKTYFGAEPNGQPFRTVVFGQPINSTEPGAMVAKAGQEVAVMFELKARQVSYNYPQGAVSTDDMGLVPKNGDIADEMAGWKTVRLSSGPAPPPTIRKLSLGFGVDRSPTPMFAADFSDCAATAGWMQTNRSGAAPVDAWNCAVYGPEGEVRVFEGSRPGTCLTAQCDPWSTASGFSALAELISPPIHVGAAQSPYLTLYHQYSSKVIVDRPQDGSDHYFLVQQNMRVAVQILDKDTHAWSLPIDLEPLGGYDTETTAGLFDPLRGPRQARVSLASECTTVDDDFSNYDPRCGWWHPAGFLPFESRAGSAVNGVAHTGSEWTVSRVPLFGLPFGDPKLVDVTDETIRIVLRVRRDGAGDPRYPDPPQDFGWRIGGLQISDEPEAARDLGVQGLSLAELPFDPTVLGLGPGTPIRLNVTVANNGRLEVRNANVVVQGFTEAGEVCANLAGSGPMAPGETRNVTALCPLSPSAAGIVRFVATISPANDDFPADNRFALKTRYPIQAFANIGVSTATSQPAGPVGANRIIDIVLHNNGNVPIEGFTVRRVVSAAREDGDRDLLQSRIWEFDGVLDVGQSRSFLDPALEPSEPLEPTEANFLPQQPGSYLVVASAEYAEDQDPSDNAESLDLTASLVLFRQDFDHGAQAEPGIVDPSSVPVFDPAWSIQSNGLLGTRSLLAGDPATGELPLDGDETFTLPALNLATARSASLSFTHRFFFENSYDAGRVEISTDGGATWRTVTPLSNPVVGLPGGYSDAPIVAINPLLSQHATDAGAFTGKSSELPNTEDGWFTSTIDFADDPEFQRQTELDAFDPTGFPSLPTSSQPKDGATQFLANPGWKLDEPGADGNNRYWWIENIPFDQPAPHDGDLMWWSGTYGVFPGKDTDTTLTASLVPTAALSAIDDRPIWFRWWDWRSGGSDGPAPLGTTGGTFAATRLAQDADLDGLPNELENVTGTDWLRANTDDDTAAWGVQGQPVTIGWADGLEYFSGANPADKDNNPQDQNLDGFPDAWFDALAAKAQQPVGGPQAHDDNDGLTNIQEAARGTLPRKPDTDGDGVSDGAEILRKTDPTVADVVYTDEVRPDGWTQHRVDISRARGQAQMEFRFRSVYDETTNQDPKSKENRGVFIDDAEIVQADVDPFGRLVDPTPLVDLDSFEDEETPRWTTGLVANTENRWTRVGAHNQKPETGWRVAEPLTVPGAGPSTPWHFAADNAQGYPHLADARLVTPVIDLSRAPGSSATLRFDHRYELESDDSQSSLECISRCFPIAGDAAVVEYQVQDTATGAFGPWRQLAATPIDELDGFLFDRADPFNPTLSPYDDGGDRFFDAESAGRFAASGYTALELRDPGDIGTHDCSHPAVGHGYGFTRFTGAHKQVGLDPSVEECPWQDRPYSVVFSGDSNGWQHVEWPIGQLAGQKVRFAFHAASNPSFEGDDPLLGWQVANVGVVASTFQGKETLVRFRVGTDGSLPKGSWQIDDITVVGDRYTDLTILQTSSPGTVRAAPGSWVDFYANVTNVGTDPRNGLALLMEPHGGAEFTIVTPAGLAVIPESSLSDGFTQGKGPFTLFGGGQAGSRLPIHVRLRAPIDGQQATIRVGVYEQQTPTTYVRAQNEVPSTTTDTWRILGSSETLIVPIAPSAQSPELLRQEPAVAAINAPSTFTARIRNDGTTTPAMSAVWTFYEILAKGDVAHPKTSESKIGTPLPSQTLGALPPRGEVPSTASFSPTHVGLYRASVQFLANGQPIGLPITREFLVGIEGNYHKTDFTIDNAAKKGWRDASPEPDEFNGGSPPELRFRQSGPAFLWGVSDEQLGLGLDYCSFGGCNFPMRRTVTTVTGLEGVALSPLIDLRRVPESAASITLDHRFIFTDPGDGARLEAIAYDPKTIDNANPLPAFVCQAADGSQVPERFILRPDAAAPGRAFSLPAIAVPPTGTGGGVQFVPIRVNPLAGSPPAAVDAFGGEPSPSQVDRYQLSTTPTSSCANPTPKPVGFTLLDYPIRIVLHTGTLPGATELQYLRTGSQGWRVNAVSVSSSSVDVSPETLRIPLLDGTPKRFNVLVTNTGPTADRMTVSVDAQRTTLPDTTWVQIGTPVVELGPGESKAVPYTIEVPTSAALSRGTYNVILVARSQLDPNVLASAFDTVILGANPLPDLSVSLSLGTSQVEGVLEQETIVPVFATIVNAGVADSTPVRLTVEAVDTTDETRADIGSVIVPALCAPLRAELGVCLGPTSASLFLEWSTPPKPGPYSVVATVDPDGRILEETTSNNVDTLDVTVTPIRQVDLAILDVRVVGFAGNAIVEEGDLISIATAVTNAGALTANGVTVQLYMGATQLAERRFDSLPPGVIVNVTASVLAIRGDFILKALAIAEGKQGADAQLANNEFKRLLRVRSHDLASGPLANLTVLPGEQATTTFTLHNRGNTLERLVASIAPSLAAQGWNASVAPVPLILAPGSSAAVAAIVDVPPGALKGLHRVPLLFHAPGSDVTLANATLLVTVQGSARAPAIAFQGDRRAPGIGTLDVTVQSLSNLAQNVSLNVTQPSWGRATDPTRLQPGETRNATVPIQVPSTTLPGTYAVTLSAIGDGNRTLNRTTQNVTILAHAQAGFAWGSLGSRDAVLPTQRILKLEVAIENTGNVPVTYRLVPPTAGGALLAVYADPEPLGPGEQRTITWNLTIPKSADIQTLDAVQAWIDTEGDNGTSALAQILPFPDVDAAANLIVRSTTMRPAANATPGKPLRVDVDVANLGGAASQSSYVYAYLDGVLVDIAPVQPVGAGKDAIVTFNWTAPDSGDHLFLFVANANATSLESTREDNSASMPLSVKGASLGDRVGGVVPAPGLPLLLLVGAAALAVTRIRRGRS